MSRRTKPAYIVMGKDDTNLQEKIEVDDEGEIDMGIKNARSYVNKILNQEPKTETQATEDMKRIEKKAGMKILRQCCSCKDEVVIKSNGTTLCCDHICLDCCGTYSHHRKREVGTAELQ